MQPQEETRSALTGWVLAIIRAIRSDGVDADAVLKEIGIDPALLAGGYSRYSQEQVNQLWRKAIDRTGDPLFGFKVAAEVRPATFHVVGYAMSCSATLLRALQRFARYCRLISDSATATLTEHGDEIVLEFHFDTGGQPPIYQTVETVVASVVSFMRWIANEPVEPIDVRLQHPPSSAAGAYEEFYGCPVQFGQLRNCVVFRKSDLERPILSSDEELASLLDGVANRDLEKRMAGRLAVRVRDVLIARLPHNIPSKAETAKILNMSERTLLRRLKEEGTTFVDVLQHLREEMAFRYLNQGTSLSETAYLLGFSDNGTFSRAFKQWTGRRPSTVSPAEPETKPAPAVKSRSKASGARA